MAVHARTWATHRHDMGYSVCRLCAVVSQHQQVDSSDSISPAQPAHQHDNESPSSQIQQIASVCMNDIDKRIQELIIVLAVTTACAAWASLSHAGHL